jgi:two-component sensor histidine kinase
MATLSIADVTITSELSMRPSHLPDVSAETAAMRQLGRVVADGPERVFQTCVEVGLQICRADTCGISVYERTSNGEEIFRWIALAGVLKDHLHGTTPRHFSPCGVCVDSNAPVLMRRPELVYEYLAVGPAFHDVLLIPLAEQGSSLVGTLWVVSHNSERKFDSGDARGMQRIATFAAMALQLARLSEIARAEIAASKTAFKELEHRVKNTLQITAGLLDMQHRRTSDTIAKQAIKTASERVRTMGEAHRIATDAEFTDLMVVIRDVCSSVFGADYGRRLRVVGPDALIILATKAAVVAPIINELATNAVKYALNDAAVSVTVSVEVTGKQVVLAMADDGAPLSDDVLSGRKSGLGLCLIRSLANQLGGAFEVDVATKRFVVAFPCDRSPIEAR